MNEYNTIIARLTSEAAKPLTDLDQLVRLTPGEVKSIVSILDTITESFSPRGKTNDPLTYREDY